MKNQMILAVVLGMSVAGFAQTGKPCEELKSEIAKKLETNGVKTYTLDVIAKDKDAEGKIVGTCEGGTKKIVYRRGQDADQTAAKTKDQTANAGR